MKSTFFSIQSSLFEDERFKRLSCAARFTLIVLKDSLPQSNIDIKFGICEEIAYKTGLDEIQVPGCLQELQDAGFIKYLDKVIWIIRGLEHNPLYSEKNEKVNTSIRRQVNDLKNHPLAVEFRQRYSWIFKDEDGLADRVEGGSTDTPSDTLSDSPSKGSSLYISSSSSLSSNKKSINSLRGHSRSREQDFLAPWEEEAVGDWTKRIGSLSKKNEKVLSSAIRPCLDNDDWMSVRRVWVHYLETTPDEYISLKGVENNFTAKYDAHRRALDKSLTPTEEVQAAVNLDQVAGYTVKDAGPSFDF